MHDQRENALKIDNMRSLAFQLNSGKSVRSVEIPHINFIHEGFWLQDSHRREALRRQVDLPIFAVVFLEVG